MSLCNIKTTVADENLTGSGFPVLDAEQTGYLPLLFSPFKQRHQRADQWEWFNTAVT